MSAPQVPGAPAGASGEVPATPTAAPAVPQASASATTPQPKDEDQPWFKERLARSEEQARQKLLDELGVKDPAKAKKAIEAAAKVEEEAKSVAEKLADEAKSRGKAESEVERLRGITTEFATRQMMALTPDQQKAVKDIAGEDSASQLKAITALAPTWAKPAQAAAQTQTAPPATGTAPPPAAPDGTTISPADHKAVYAALQKTNPFAAASYALEHLRDVFPEQPTQ